MNSMDNEAEALNSGDFLQGFYLSVNFVYSGSDFAWMFSPYISWTPNNRQFKT